MRGEVLGDVVSRVWEAVAAWEVVPFANGVKRWVLRMTGVHPSHHAGFRSARFRLFEYWHGFVSRRAID
jgi:hypothetical protein